MAASALGQDSALDFTNAPDVRLRLSEGSVIVVDGQAGDIHVECALAGGYCDGLAGAGQNGQLPTALLQRLDQTSRLIPGSFVRVGWSSTGAAACLQSSTGPAALTWTGPRKPQWLSGQYVVLPVVGTYTLSLRCFNPSGASDPVSLSVTVVAALPNDPTPLPPPNIDPNNPTTPDDPPPPPNRLQLCSAWH